MATDPDAALHRAKAGKYKPRAVIDPAPVQDSGTIADTVERLPELAPVRPTSTPIEDPATLGEVFSASKRVARSDRSDFDNIMVQDGYQPIIRALGLPDSENPATFQTEFQGAMAGGKEMLGHPSQLATAAGQGETWFSGSQRLAHRELQERLIVAEIRRRRAKDPKFLAGIPDTVDGLHKYFLENEKKKRAIAQGTVARSPGGVLGFGASLAGGVFEGFHDPLNLETLPIGGGGKTILQTVARETLINGALELGQQPIVAHNRAELGEHLTLGEVVSNTVTSGLAGGVLEGAAKGVGKGISATGIPRAAAAKIREAAMALAARGMQIEINPKVPIDRALAELDNRQLIALHRELAGGKLTPDEEAAAHVLERGQEIGESSPYHAGPAGDGRNEGELAQAIKDLEDRLTPEDRPSSETAGVEAPAPARPRAEASTAAPRPQMNPRFELEGEAEIQHYINKVRRVESSGNDAADNPRSSADGRFQITDGTFRDYHKRIYGEDPGAHPSQAFKNEPARQERIMAAITRDDAAKLASIGEAINDGNLYLMHFLGLGDGPKVFRADPSTPIERIVSPQVIAANPFLKGKSASQVIAWAHDRMGAAVASVPARPGFTTSLDAAGDDPAVAQLRDEAMRLDDQVIGSSSSSAAGGVPPMYAKSFNVDDITVDAKRFQFKGGADDLGVTDRLKGVTEWNPLYAGRVVTWEDAKGRVFLADGHQRHGLARRIQAATGQTIQMDAINLREADGISAADARVYAALKNIAEGTGTAVDAAKVIRDAGDQVLAHLPPKSALVRDGAALARLSDDAFGAVYNGVLPADHAAVIGHLLPNSPDAHGAMVELLVKLDPATRSQAESIVRQGMAAGLHHETQEELFGTRELVSSLMLERAKVLERGLADLRKMRLVHKTAAEGADTLEATGSRIAKAASEKEAKANGEAVEIVSRLAFRAGPVADALNDAARELAGGAKLADVSRKFAARIRELDLAAVSREAGRDDADGFAVDGSGRGGERRAPGEAVPEEPGDPGEPGLFELEQATERFSDPDGQGTKEQAESLEHDLTAALEAMRRPRGLAELDHVLEHQRGAELDDLLERAKVNQAELAKIGHELADVAGVEFVDPGAKSRDRVLAKAADYSDPGEIKDLARAGFLVDEPGQADKILAELAARFPVYDKGWRPLNGYLDRKLVVRFPNGGVAEIQIIPKVLSDEKFGRGHALYERARDPSTPIDEFEAIVSEMKANYERLLEGTDFAALGKMDANASGSSSVPSSNAERTVETDASRQAPLSNTKPLSGSDTATARSSSSNSLIDQSPQGLDMGAIDDPGKIARDRQLVDLGAAAPLRAAGDVDQLGEIGLGLFDNADQITFRLGEEGEEISAADLLAELKDDAAAIETLKGCL